MQQDTCGCSETLALLLAVQDCHGNAIPSPVYPTTLRQPGSEESKDNQFTCGDRTTLNFVLASHHVEENIEKVWLGGVAGVDPGKARGNMMGSE